MKSKRQKIGSVKKAFLCINCQREIKPLSYGTRNRNHCSGCLWSKHVDKVPGDRLAACGGKMKPVALTFKKEGLDKYGQEKQGELMLVHQCLVCGKISINRIAGDDSENQILAVFEDSLKGDLAEYLAGQGVEILSQNDRAEIQTQLFGK